MMTASAAVQVKRNSSPTLVGTKCVLIFGGAEDDPQLVIDCIQNAQALGRRPIPILKSTGIVSEWCSQNDVYYHLYRAKLGTDPSDYKITLGWLISAVGDLQSLIERYAPSDVVCFGRSPYLVAVRLASWLTGVQGRTSVVGTSLSVPAVKFEKLDHRLSTDVIQDCSQMVLRESPPKPSLRKLVFLPLAILSVCVWLNLSRVIYLGFKRSMDAVLAGLMLLAAFPFVVIKTLLLLRRGGNPIAVLDVHGKEHSQFQLYKFADSPADLSKWTALDWIPSLFNIACGQLSFVGPRILTTSQQPANLYWLAPGIFSWSNVGASKDHHGPDALDAQYMSGVSLRLDLKIFLLSLKQSLRRK